MTDKPQEQPKEQGLQGLAFDPAFGPADPSRVSPSRPVGFNPGEEEFCARFKARMLALAGPTFEDGGSIAEYADMAAPTYWEDEDQRAEGPEECALADVSYWGDE